MTHAPETGIINRPHFLEPVSCMCHANKGPDSSGSRFRHRLEITVLFQAIKWHACYWNDDL